MSRSMMIDRVCRLFIDIYFVYKSDGDDHNFSTALKAAYFHIFSTMFTPLSIDSTNHELYLYYSIISY